MLRASILTTAIRRPDLDAHAVAALALDDVGERYRDQAAALLALAREPDVIVRHYPGAQVIGYTPADD